MSGISADIVVFPVRGRRWVVYNVFVRACLAVETDGLDLLARAAEGAIPFEDEKLAFRVWKISEFSNNAGLLADPTRFKRDPAAWPDPIMLTGKEAVELFRKQWLLIDDPNAYRRRFAAKTSVTDGGHFGNFHQQLGAELLLSRRIKPDDWWLNQKFQPDFKGLRDNAYRAVQEHFLRSYFPKRIPKGSSVVDVGCGVGYYSNMLARGGAAVLGVDPNAAFLDIAKREAAENARFELMAPGTPGGLAAIPDASADFVFMSDALLFYFVAATPSQKADPAILLADVRRILKPGGTFISMEPHYLYWLAPWFGEVDHPFTIQTEYLDKRFGVTPPFSALIQTFCSQGFAVTWMEELRPDPSFQKSDARAYHFGREFPLWQVFELKKQP